MTEVIHMAGTASYSPRRRAEHWVSWRLSEESDLRRLYPTGSKADIVERFPERTWASILRRAMDLGLKRLERVPRSKKLHPVVNALIDQRIARNLTRADVSRHLGWDADWICRYERGITIPDLPTLDAWSAALEMQITIAPVLRCAAESATNQE